MTASIVDQPPPVANERPHIADLVCADIQERKRLGLERYGVALQPHNGRDALVDHYQELLDGVKYIRQEIEERRDHRADGAREERERIVGYLRHHAAQIEADDWTAAHVLSDIASDVERCAHHDTLPAPPPEDGAVGGNASGRIREETLNDTDLSFYGYDSEDT